MCKKSRKLTRSSIGPKGFTLVELLVAMALGSIVMAAIYAIFIKSNRSYVIQDQVVSAQQNVRAAMEVMVHEVRMAGYIPEANKSGADNIPADVAAGVGSAGAWRDGTDEQIEEAAATAITFEADLNADDKTETIRYALSGTNMTRESWEWDPPSTGTGTWLPQTSGAVVLAENITGFTLTYTFADGDTGIPSNTDADDTNDREHVRGVTIVITGRTRSPDLSYTNPDDGTNYRTRTLRTFIKMRNMGLS